MPELTDEDRRHGLDFATELSLLAARAPDSFCERIVHKLVNQIRQRYGYSTRLKKEQILKLARDRGGISVADIVTTTGWHRDEVFDMARELENEKRIEFRKATPAGSKGGRPALLIFVLETRSFAPPQTITAG